MAQASSEPLFDSQMSQCYPLRILLVEDNIVNQKVALRILERLGYRADTATNGLNALTTVQKQPYDLIFMDVQMPQMDGIEATRRIRQQVPAAEQPWIVAMTAHALAGDRERYLACGMNDYISKPIGVEALAKVLTWSSQEIGRQRNCNVAG
jgi:CheY-like chemotaxis protein